MAATPSLPCSLRSPRETTAGGLEGNLKGPATEIWSTGRFPNMLYCLGTTVLEIFGDEHEEP